MQILNTFCASFYGSGLWDIFSPDCERLYAAWNVAVRHAWGVPNTTHRYLIEKISGSLHPKVMLASRYIGFFKSLCTSPKYNMRVLARLLGTDMRTVMGRTIQKISTECSLSSLTPALVKKNMKYFQIPCDEEWRIDPLTELLSDSLEVPGFSSEELEEIKAFLCTS